MAETPPRLTPREEEIMQLIWKLRRAFLKDIMAQLPDPTMKQSTVSTIIRLLQEKGYVGFKAYGKTYEYYPLIPQATYAHDRLNRLVGAYFNGSFRRLLSAFVRREELSAKELNELQELIARAEEEDASGNKEADN